MLLYSGCRLKPRPIFRHLTPLDTSVWAFIGRFCVYAIRTQILWAAGSCIYRNRLRKSLHQLYMGRYTRKPGIPISGFPTRTYPNQHAKQQRLARSMDLWIILHFLVMWCFPISDYINKGADQTTRICERWCAHLLFKNSWRQFLSHRRSYGKVSQDRRHWWVYNAINHAITHINLMHKRNTCKSYRSRSNCIFND